MNNKDIIKKLQDEDGIAVADGEINHSVNAKNVLELLPKYKGTFDMEKFKGCVEDCILGLNEVLDEGLPLHPLKEQQKSVSQYRQIGLGVMGIADMLIKLNIRYGSIEAIKLCEEISKNMLNSAVKKSALIAK